MQYWLLKSEPSSWSWQNQLDRGDTGEGWDGVRNHQASNNMKAMQIGDLAFSIIRSMKSRLLALLKFVRCIILTLPMRRGVLAWSRSKR